MRVCIQCGMTPITLEGDDFCSLTSEDSEMIVTPPQYQAILSRGEMFSGRVELYAPLNAPVQVGSYRTRDGGVVAIKSVGRVAVGSNGVHYVAETGEAIRESQFHGLAHFITEG